MDPNVQAPAPKKPKKKKGKKKASSESVQKKATESDDSSEQRNPPKATSNAKPATKESSDEAIDKNAKKLAKKELKVQPPGPKSSKIGKKKATPAPEGSKQVKKKTIINPDLKAEEPQDIPDDIPDDILDDIPDDIPGALGQIWKMPPCETPFGLARGLELESVFYHFQLRDKVLMFVTWKGFEGMDAVPLDQLKLAYPAKVNEYFDLKEEEPQDIPDDIPDERPDEIPDERPDDLPDDIPSGSSGSRARPPGSLDQDWKMPPCETPFGLARGLELESVLHHFELRDKVLMFVTWKGFEGMDAVPLDQLKLAYPAKVNEYFGSLEQG